MPSVCFLLSILALLIGTVALGGFWDKISAFFLYPYIPLAILGSIAGGILDIRAILKKDHIFKNVLLLPLCAIHLLLGIWFLILHQAF